MNFPQSIRIVEVGSRDGLQSEAVIVPVDVRVGLIERLVAAGLETIEAGAFVRGEKVPQMIGSAEVLEKVLLNRRTCFPVLVPNLRGFMDASRAGAREVAVLTAASETFSRRNLNCSISESLERITKIGSLARAEGVLLRGYISCALGCPYEGRVDAACLVEIASELRRLGCHEISIGDTIGVGTVFQARTLVDRVACAVPMECIAGHFHDTYGQALANIYGCIEMGVRVFDCAVGGLGGCPYAPGATGNVATEDVVYMLRDSGIETKVDLNKLLEASTYICDYLGRPPQSRVARALAGKIYAESRCVAGTLKGRGTGCLSLRNQD